MRMPSRSARRATGAALLTVVLSACPSPEQNADAGGGSSWPANEVAAAAPSAGVIDSALPLEEELRRFRADLPHVPVALTGGATGRDALAREFAGALTRADTASLRRMLLTKAEFAYLIYPASSYTRPPYRQAPSLVWMQLEQGSETGLRRLLARRAGRPIAHAGASCMAAPEVAGASRLWRQCRLRSVPAPGDTVAERLFGVIVEHRGRFKFASYANEL
jgi:hypothetical protein